MAELMRQIYAAKFWDKAIPLPEIVSVPGEAFYGEGYDDSDRRIPDITKATRLLRWNPVWSVRDALETSMQYYVSEYGKTRAAVANG